MRFDHQILKAGHPFCGKDFLKKLPYVLTMVDHLNYELSLNLDRKINPKYHIKLALGEDLK